MIGRFFTMSFFKGGFFTTDLALLAQEPVTIETLQQDAQWWGRLGNVLFIGLIALLVVFVLFTAWRRTVNRKQEQLQKQATVEEILAEDISAKKKEPVRPNKTTE